LTIEIKHMGKLTGMRDSMRSVLQQGAHHEAQKFTR